MSDNAHNHLCVARQHRYLNSCSGVLALGTHCFEASQAPCEFQVLASRYRLQTAAAAVAPLHPLEQLRSDMEMALQLAAAMEQCISPYLPAATLQMEMQVAAMLANMESVGLGTSQSTCTMSAFPAVACQESCQVNWSGAV